MRDILFRGKRTDTSVWAEGSLIKVNEYCCILGKGCEDYGCTYLDSELGYIDGQAAPVDPETISQYTGFRDANGTKIFEGDIIAAIPRKVSSAPTIFITIKDIRECRYLGFCSQEYIVVANIHDDPDFIKNATGGHEITGTPRGLRVLTNPLDEWSGGDE